MPFIDDDNHVDTRQNMALAIEMTAQAARDLIWRQNPHTPRFRARKKVWYDGRV